jgi:deferrochelatase/peroxidase EfeB
VGSSDKQLQYSHIGRARQRRNISPILKDSLRIYRQGFEYLELLDKHPFFRTGLNFISFQDHPSRIINLLTSPHWLGGSSFGGDPQYPIESLRNFVTVRAAGIFYVPPLSSDESFPGESIFW